jgi:glycyl-tRNA synthetase
MSKVANEPDSAAHKKEAFRLLVKNTLERRLFYIPSFKIYGGVAGLYDYGPWGCAVETNLLNLWRQVSRFWQKKSDRNLETEEKSCIGFTKD